MEIPVINGWEITTNENDVKMATLPQEKMLEIMKYLEAQTKVNVDLGSVINSCKTGCCYSKAMNQSSPRLCVRCDKPEFDYL